MRECPITATTTTTGRRAESAAAAALAYKTEKRTPPESAGCTGWVGVWRRKVPESQWQ